MATKPVLLGDGFSSSNLFRSGTPWGYLRRRWMLEIRTWSQTFSGG
ncbi:hypothetical protein [Azospirillum doebereinerae]